MEEFLLGFLLCAMSVILMLQVIMRYIFSNPLIWSEEAARYCFVIAAFASCGYCVRRNVIIRVDVISQKFPARIQKVLELIMWLSMIFLFAWLSYSCIDVVQQAALAGRTSTAMQIPMQYVYCIPLIGFLWTIFRVIQKIWRTYLHRPRKES